MAVSPITVGFHETSLLHLGGVWISSDFYSHSGGYRLYLVLKSTKIDRPTGTQRTTKPDQEIAVLAIEGGTERHWPCEGTATMRFESPLNDRLRGQPNSSFSVKFSIGEPSTNIQLGVKFEGKFPPGLVRSWTSIPQECIPFFLEHIPSFIDRITGSQYAAGIVMSKNDNITIKIEDIQIKAQRGVKRPLDASPPRGIKKLAELEPKLNLPLSKLVPDSGIAQPGNLNIVHNGPRSAVFSWTPPPVEQHSDAITGYIVVYESERSQHILSADLKGADNTSCECAFLKPSTLYTFSVRARTTAGYGPKAEMQFKTPEEAPSACPGGLTVTYRLPTTATLSWRPVPEEMLNEVITGYIVQVEGPDDADYHSEQSVSPDATCTEIPNLHPNVKYTFSVSARTAAGVGPPATISSVTPQRGMDLENMEHYAAYQQALKDGSHLTLSYLKFLFFGPPRSGKTSMRRRLIREILNLSQLTEPSVSTGVAETNDVIVKKFTNESVAVANSQWCSIKRANEDTSQPNTGSEDDPRYLTQLFYKLICRHATSSASTTNQPAQVQPQRDSSLLRTAAHPSMDTAQLAPVASVSINPEGVEIENAFVELITILQSESPEELERLLEELILINMTDVGGQPAFLDMLPALTTGPALYLLLFRLDQELKAYYPVRYLPADGNGEMTLESSYSIEEVLFRSLASIACFSCPSQIAVSVSMQHESISAQSASIPAASESAEPASEVCTAKNAESASKPQASSRALLFGTYKDKVDDDQIAQIEGTLQEKFTKTKLYGEGLLLKSRRGRMLLTVDNMFGTDESEMSDIRKDIERIIKANFPPVPIPASWLMFRIVLQLLNKPVVSLAQCEEIAQRFSMPTSVEEAIWFFHHNIGSLMHYPDIPSMENMIICDPQVIFDCISTLIINKFKYENRELESCVVDEFSQKGQFSLSHIKDTAGHSNYPLTLDQLMDLLKHHNVVAEITHDQNSEPKFIMPAVLKFASEEELNTPIAGSSEHQVIMIHFDGGFVPFGVFSTCTARLIAHQDSLPPNWRLCEELVRRNKITFRIDGAFYAVIIARPQYLEIIVSRHPRARCKRSLLEICSTVRQTVTETLKTVISKMKYKPFGTLLSSSTEQPFDLAFRCCLEDSHSDHLMKVVNAEDGRYAQCLKEDMSIDLEEKHHIWFNLGENEMQCETSTSSSNIYSSSLTGKLPSGGEGGGAAASGTAAGGVSAKPAPSNEEKLLKARPNIGDFTLIKYKTDNKQQQLNILNRAANQWEYIADGLFPGNTDLTRNLEERHRGDPKKCLRELFLDFLSKKLPPEYSRDWNGIIQLLKDVGEDALAEDVKVAVLNKGGK